MVSTLVQGKELGREGSPDGSSGAEMVKMHEMRWSVDRSRALTCRVLQMMASRVWAVRTWAGVRTLPNTYVGTRTPSLTSPKGNGDGFTRRRLIGPVSV